MNWINSFEMLCYFIVGILLFNIFKNKNYKELGLLISGALAGFSLELLAVRLTDIYHYSNDFFISVGFRPYQFPFFGGMMWGGITVCALRLSRIFSLNKLMTALLAGWIIVSMDLLLDVVAIRLDGGFWVWDGRPINLIINHHMFMSVIWVNFLGYMFEVPVIVYMTLKAYEKEKNQNKINVGKSLLIGLSGVVFVGICSYISLFFDKVTDEWFSFVAFVILWTYIFIKLISYLIKNRNLIRISRNKDYPLLTFWFAMYAYCISGLIKLEIIQARPLYGIFSGFLFILTIFLGLIEIKE